MTESIESKPKKQIVYRKNPHTGNVYPSGKAVSGHDVVPDYLPDGTRLLTEEEHQRRQAGTGSFVAHVAQADEEREEKEKKGSI